MNAPFNLKELERKAFRSFYQDGIWDIFFGLMMLAMYAFTLFNDNFENKALRILALVFIEIAAMFFLIYGKKEITAPRLGHVVFGPKRKRRFVYIFIVNLVALVAGVVLYGANDLLSLNLEQSELIAPLGMGVWIAFLTSIMAYFLDFDRLYIYALIYGSAFAAVLLLDLPILFLVAALLILIPGGVIFFRFLSTTKPVSEE